LDGNERLFRPRLYPPRTRPGIDDNPLTGSRTYDAA
jgi:hypothetical protein